MVLAQHSPWISTCMVHLSPCGNMGLRDQHKPQLQQDHGPRHFSQLHFRPGQHHGPRWQGRSLRSVWTQLQNNPQTSNMTSGDMWISAWPSVLTETMEINRDPGNSRATDLDMVFGCNLGPNVTMVLGGSTGHSYQLGSSSGVALGH